MPARVLLLEDDRLFGETLVDFLEGEGYEVVHFPEAKSAIDAVYGDDFDLYLLDVNVPDMNGFDLLKQLRESGDKTPAIFITSARDKEALATGFHSGADDYMKKPIDLDELLLRIEAQLRRHRRSQKVQVGEYLFDMERLVLYKDAEPVALPKKLAELLGLLLRNRGEVVSTEEILQEIYGEENPGTGALRVYINKLKQLFGKDAITNIRGIGYCFEA
ncbi:response regulator transcription factor [Hydrogenimonas cancrithermarum]|uniref:Two-component response regulator n=1 Tax=Hydrogenimonas cancrithermarum TaxID=2993563 RepID=A0ABN6WWA8_9BACT|nr:response regulator transcription factor [Hydrogenimonas cancrithermarum]BDY12457.1 two-component response regulator [Hydrogenimonas cancrithermarum]